MNSLSQNFLTLNEQKDITGAVHAAESKTSGEIVPLVVSESYTYPMAAIRGGILISLPLALLLTAPVAGMFWLHPCNMWVFLLLMFPIFWASFLVIQRFPRLKRFFLFQKEMTEEVEEAAHVSFFTEGLYKTKNANGILLFISLLERQAWVVADSGINDRIPVEKWKDAISIVIKGVNEKKQSRAICQAITQIGNILQKEFPIQAGDKNELHDLIIR